jgi:hypothetical protein
MVCQFGGAPTTLIVRRVFWLRDVGHQVFPYQNDVAAYQFDSFRGERLSSRIAEAQRHLWQASNMD